MRPRVWLVNAFIAFHVACIASWSVPAPLQPALVRAWNALVAPYMLRTGLWQGWDMFAPNPLAINIDVDADVTYRDGRHGTWVFPRMQELSYWERYRQERYRKWRERVRLDAYALIWPDTARFVARLAARPGAPVDLVALTRHWAEIPPPVGSPLAPRLAEVVMPHQYRFFVYAVPREARP